MSSKVRTELKRQTSGCFRQLFIPSVVEKSKGTSDADPGVSTKVPVFDELLGIETVVLAFETLLSCFLHSRNCFLGSCVRELPIVLSIFH